MADLLVVSCTVAGNQIENPAGGYEVTSYGRGDGKMRRATVESEDVAGRLLLAAVPEVMLGHVAVRVKGTTAADCKTKLDTLIGWFRGFDYTLTATLASTAAAGNWVESWRCEPADYVLGASGLIDNELLYHFMQEIEFTWPHDPTAL